MDTCMTSEQVDAMIARLVEMQIRAVYLTELFKRSFAYANACKKELADIEKEFRIISESLGADMPRPT